MNKKKPRHASAVKFTTHSRTPRGEMPATPYEVSAATNSTPVSEVSAATDPTSVSEITSAALAALEGALATVRDLSARRLEAKLSIARTSGVARELKELIKVMSVYGV